MEETTPIIALDNPANLQLADPDLLQYYQELDERLLYVEGKLDASTSAYRKQILLWNIEDKDIPVENRIPIKVVINSPGGWLDEALALSQTIKMSKTPVYTYNEVEACSGAFLIMIAGHKRFAMPHSTALFHLGSGSVGGTYAETMEASAEYKRSVKMMEDFVLQNTNISKQRLSRKKKTDWYMSAEDQVKFGCVDKIIDNIDDVIG